MALRGLLLLALGALQSAHALVLHPRTSSLHSAPRCWIQSDRTATRAPAPCLVDKEKLLGEAAGIEKYAEMISKIDGRTARKILYGVFALGSAAGLSTALPELVSVASGSSTDVGLGEAVAGVVVDGLTLGACVLGFKIDTGEAVAAAEVEAKAAGIPTASAMDVSALGVEVLTGRTSGGGGGGRAAGGGAALDHRARGVGRVVGVRQVGALRLEVFTSTTCSSCRCAGGARRGRQRGQGLA